MSKIFLLEYDQGTSMECDQDIPMECDQDTPMECDQGTPMEYEQDILMECDQMRFISLTSSLLQLIYFFMGVALLEYHW